MAGAGGQAQHRALAAPRARVVVPARLEGAQHRGDGSAVAVDLDVRSQGGELIDEVVDEGVAVVEQDDAHLRPPH